VDIPHFCQRMQQSHPSQPLPQTITDLKTLLVKRISMLNIEQAAEDVMPFITNRSELDIWSQEYFIALVDQMV